MPKNDEKDLSNEEADTAPKKGKKQPDANEEADTEGLVKMQKDSAHLHVHPTTVEAHKAAGWKHA